MQRAGTARGPKEAAALWGWSQPFPQHHVSQLLEGSMGPASSKVLFGYFWIGGIFPKKKVRQVPGRKLLFFIKKQQSDFAKAKENLAV